MTFALGAALAEISGGRHAQLLYMPMSVTCHPDATAFPLTPWQSGLNRWSCGVAQRTVETNNHEVLPPGLPEFVEEHPGAIYIGLGSFAGSVEENEWAVHTGAQPASRPARQAQSQTPGHCHQPRRR